MAGKRSLIYNLFLGLSGEAQVHAGVFVGYYITLYNFQAISWCIVKFDDILFLYGFTTHSTTVKNNAVFYAVL